MLGNIEPKSVLKFFEEISQIPRGSTNEKGISDYFIDFAKKRNLWAHQDKALNVYIKKPGTSGYEKAPPVILQGHMDIVCEKNEGVQHDFEKDPIKLIVEGDWLRADGTTLGADNGAAVAMSLALLDSTDIPHPPLEVLFTAAEEIGLLGAAAVDGSYFEGKMLLNMDSGLEGYFRVSCAGGARTFTTLTPEYKALPAGHIVKRVKIKGLKGGHSGNDVAKERGNSNRLLARTLRELQVKFGVCFVNISGGSKENSIPREAEAIISFDGSKLSEVSAAIKQFEQVLKREYSKSDAGVEILVEDCKEEIKKVYSEQFCRKVLTVLLTIPHGIEAMSLFFEGLPESSLNLGVITSKEDEVVIVNSIRSSVGSRKEMLLEQVAIISEAAGAKLEIKGVYPAWEYDEKSALREKAVKLYTEMYGKEPTVWGTHAGLEAGILAEQLGGIDVINFGCEILDVHSPDERMNLASLKRCWDFLLKLLVTLAR